MMKKTIKHAIAIVLLAGFAVLALGSMGSSPSSSSSSSSSSNRCPKDYTCVWVVSSEGKWRHDVCSRNSCSVQTHNEGGDLTPGTNVTCNCF